MFLQKLTNLTTKARAHAVECDGDDGRRRAEKLGERAATVFALRYFEGYDNNKIAELLGTSPTVVAVTLHRARTRLRREIGQFLEKQS